MLADGQRKVVVVLEGVVDQELRSGLIANGARSGDLHTGEANIALNSKGYPDLLVPVQSEGSELIDRNAGVPVGAGEPDIHLVDNGRRKGVDPACAEKSGGVAVNGFSYGYCCGVSVKDRETLGPDLVAGDISVFVAAAV